MSLIGCTTEIYVTNVVVRAKLEEGGGVTTRRRCAIFGNG